MKKALLLSFFLPPEKGGIQNYFLHLSRELPPDAIVWLAEPQEGDAEFDRREKFTVIRKSYRSILRYLKLSSLVLYGKTRAIVKHENIEQIWCGHIFPMGITAYFLKKRLHLPYTIFTHGKEIFEVEKKHPRKKKWLIKILRHADRIVVTTEFMQKHLMSLGVSHDRFLLLPPGVDTDTFRPGLNTATFRTRLHLEGKQILLTVGRLVERKGHDVVLKTLPALLQTFPDLRYVIVGTGPYETSLRTLANTLGVTSSVIFAGAVSEADLPLYYNLADVFVMPAREIPREGDLEGFGLVYLEAAACGVPSVGGASGGVGEAILDAQTGLLVDPLSSSDLAQALTKLLSDTNYRNTLGTSALSRAQKEFNWNTLTKRLEQ